MLQVTADLTGHGQLPLLLGARPLSPGTVVLHCVLPTQDAESPSCLSHRGRMTLHSMTRPVWPAMCPLLATLPTMPWGEGRCARRFPNRTAFLFSWQRSQARGLGVRPGDGVAAPVLWTDPSTPRHQATPLCPCMRPLPPSSGQAGQCGR